MSLIFPAGFKRPFLIPFLAAVLSGGRVALLEEGTSFPRGWQLGAVPQPRSCWGHKSSASATLSPFLKLKQSSESSAHSQIQFKPVGRLKNYCRVGLKRTGETPHSQCPHRSLIVLENRAKIIINQVMLPREAVPVGSGQAGCWLEALRLCYQKADPPTTQTHTAQGPAWGESHTGHRDTAVTVQGQSQRLISAGSGLETLQTFTNGSFLMRGRNKRKKQLYFHLDLKKEKVLWFSLGLFLWWNECISLIRNAVVYFLRYSEGKYLDGAKQMQPLQPSQKTPHIFLPLGKRHCPTERAAVSQVQKPLSTQVTAKPAYFSSGPSIVAILPLSRGCGQQHGAAGHVGFGTIGLDEGPIQVRRPQCSSPQEAWARLLPAPLR